MTLTGTHYLPVSITLPQNWNVAEHWHKANKYFYYGQIFVSPFVTGMKTTREKDFPEAEYVVADSGGYQFTSDKAPPKVSALDVLRWQEGIADVGFTLDIPAYSYKSRVKEYTHYTKDVFDKYMKLSNDNAWSMLEAQENKKFQLWAVCQGSTYKDIKRWYEHLTKEHTFPGYTFPMSSTVTRRYATGDVGDDWLGQLRFAKEVGTNFHFLGRSEPLLVLVYAKLAQKMKKLYTYDTASAAMGLMQGKYTMPFFLSALNFTKTTEPVKLDKDAHPGCSCPVCQKHTVGEIIKTYGLLLLHNVWVRVEWNKLVSGFVQDDDIFDDLVNKMLRLQPTYKKNIDKYKEGINNLIYDEPLKTEKVSSFW